MNRDRTTEVVDVPEEVRDIIANVVRRSRDYTVKDVRYKIRYSPDAPPIEEHDLEHALFPSHVTDPETDETVILVPDPTEILEMQCAGCPNRVKRPRREIEKMNREYGFPYCRVRCRDEKLREKERIFVASRDEGAP